MFLVGVCLQVCIASAVCADNTTSNAGTTIVFAPITDQYPRYLADPRAPHTSLLILGVPDSEIEGAGDVRFSTRFRARFGIVRFGDTNDPQAWQLDFEGGFFGHFDISNSLNSIGWDGTYGLFLSRQLSREWFFRVGDLHDSAHLGDEFIEETERERIKYTREEIVAGIAWVPNKTWKAYSEAGWAWDLKGEQERMRLQFGIEHYGENRFQLTDQDWYIATDVNFFEERDWRPAMTLQLGVIQPSIKPDERYRFVIEMYDGRSVLGEFSFEDETYIGLGFYYDY